MYVYRGKNHIFFPPALELGLTIVPTMVDTQIFVERMSV